MAIIGVQPEHKGKRN